MLIPPSPHCIGNWSAIAPADDENVNGSAVDPARADASPRIAYPMAIGCVHRVDCRVASSIVSIACGNAIRLSQFDELAIVFAYGRLSNTLPACIRRIIRSKLLGNRVTRSWDLADAATADLSQCVVSLERLCVRLFYRNAWFQLRTRGLSMETRWTRRDSRGFCSSASVLVSFGISLGMVVGAASFVSAADHPSPGSTTKGPASKL